MASFFESKAGKKIMAMAYGIGAAIVIIGALFKIMHWNFANEMLILGMGTEAIIFLISAFEPLHEEWDWSLVYPELAGMEGEVRSNKSLEPQGDAVSQQLDKMLSEAKIGPELIEGLGTGLKSLSSNVSSMSDLSGASVATKEYADNVMRANEQMIGMSSSYSRAVNALESLSDTTESFKETTNKVASINATLNDSLVSFDQNIQSLNKVYGGMLNAMRPNS
jgi:gliding motility-associated protein GldL